MRDARFLTVNRHTPFVYQLSKTVGRWDIVGDWNLSHRPLAQGATRLERETALDRLTAGYYRAIVLHDLKDLRPWYAAAVASRTMLILILHNKNLGSLPRRILKSIYVGLAKSLGVTVVWVSNTKRESWTKRQAPVIPFYGVPNSDVPSSGYERINKGVIAANNLDRPQLHGRVVTALIQQGVLDLAGNSEGVPSEICDSYFSFLTFVESHLWYLGATTPCDDSYNMGMIEAMSMGVPVIQLSHPTSFIVDGENGFVAGNLEDVMKIHEYLYQNPDIARKVGERGQAWVVDHFSAQKFNRQWAQLLDTNKRE